MTPRSARHTKHAALGFTLLEAIVAMSIMATTLLVLYAWLGSNTIAVARAQEAALALQDAEVAFSVIEGINPMQTPEGSHEAGALTIRWQASPISEERTGITRGGGIAPFKFTLYDVSVETLRAGKVTHSFNVRRMGWVSTHVFNPDTDL